MEPLTVLEIAGLEKAYDAFALGPVDLTVEDEILAVLGPSGGGKTTLLSAIAGIVPADRGAVVLDGVRLDGRPPEDRGTALVFQDGALFPHLTARENVAYAAAPGTDVDDLAATLEIEDVLDRSARTLSGGEGKRVALARALAADPDVLLLDEPLANLDAPIKRRLRDDLRDLLAPLPIPVVSVTHDQTVAAGIGDRVAVLAEGRVAQIGPPRQVFERPATPFVATFTGSANVFPARVEPDGVLAWGSRRLAVHLPDATPGDEVRFTVRPENVAVHGDAAAIDGDVLRGRIVGRTYDGGTYRVAVEPDDVDAVLEVTVLPPAYERHGLDAADRIAVSFPPDAIHVLEPDAGS